MPTAVIAFDFDPLLRLGDGVVRWETVAIAASLFVALAIAGLGAREASLRPDDLLFVVLGIVPGAVLGGRLGYVLLHPGFFVAEPGRILDPGTGSLELTLAIVGGALTGSAVAVLLDGRPGPWLHVAALPMLLAVFLGKLGTVLGGTGQGMPTSGEPATAYLGPGPWGSLGPEIPSIPSQALEALAAAIVLAIVLVLATVRPTRPRDGRLFVVGLGLWALARAIVAATWRDPLVIGPLRMEQVIDVVVGAGAASLVAWLMVRDRRGGNDPAPEIQVAISPGSDVRR